MNAAADVRTHLESRLAGSLAGALLVAAPLGAHGQTSPTIEAEASLERAQAFADAGEIQRARTSLSEWYRVTSAPSPEEGTRARLLRARLAQDPDSAELDYVWVAIEGSSPYAPEAWFRLAQLRLLRGNPSRALADLERLRASYPTDRRLAESWLWTGHAAEALGDLNGACEAWRRAEPRDAEVRQLVEVALEACDSSAPGFAVQLGAFRSASSAEQLQQRIEATGVEVHVVRPPSEDRLYRVQTGAFAHLSSAARVAQELRRQGFDAVVVSSAPRRSS